MGKKAKPVIIVDSREWRHPYTFSDAVCTVTKKLDTGDYSLEGYEEKITVERKELNDFINTCLYGMDRFERELDRMTGFENAIIAVEGSVDDIINRRYHSRAHPHSILGFGVSIELKYGVAVHFWHNRQLSQYMVERYLLKWLDYKREKNNGIKYGNAQGESDLFVCEKTIPDWVVDRRNSLD